MTIHHFVPSVYYNTMGGHPPALHVADGDSVVTTTVDGAGYDATGEQVAAWSNPQTGPFYVEGAEPGDALAVHLDYLWPNRNRAHSSTRVVANIVDPEFVPTLPREHVQGVWEIDRERGTATLVEPESKLGGLSFAIEPMVGCLGVAPGRGQVISTSTSGKHGGNMDYRCFVTGTTVYFPVFVSGALFSLGDGHALQGDGEIVGTGVEVSLDVRFTVRVVRGLHLEWPRAENQDCIMTIGNARPLDQALQHATTEMLRWLDESFGYDPRTASSLLGQCVRYEVANVCDPAFTIVCKLAKRFVI
jgi:amidase